MKLSISHLAGALLAVAFASGGAAATLGGPLRLADEGSFFVGGRTIETPHAGTSPAGVVPPGRIVVDQMYVQYRIPEGSAGRVPIVLVHGGGLTGASYETTPDGREGFARAIRCTWSTRLGADVRALTRAPSMKREPRAM